LTALCPCQVLVDLVLGASPSPQQQAELESELQSLGLEEALSEVVYQVPGVPGCEQEGRNRMYCPFVCAHLCLPPPINQRHTTCLAVVRN
jgi:hypothetical protein